MTLEEAADILSKCSMDYSDNDRVLQAFDMGIQSLYQQPCTPECKVCEAFFQQSMRPATEEEGELKALKEKEKTNPCDYCQEFDCCGCVYL